MQLHCIKTAALGKADYAIAGNTVIYHIYLIHFQCDIVTTLSTSNLCIHTNNRFMAITHVNPR